MVKSLECHASALLLKTMPHAAAPVWLMISCSCFNALDTPRAKLLVPCCWCCLLLLSACVVACCAARIQVATAWRLVGP